MLAAAASVELVLGAGGLRGRIAVLEHKERLSLRNIVDKSCEPRQWRRGYVTNEPFAVSSRGNRHGWEREQGHSRR